MGCGSSLPECQLGCGRNAMPNSKLCAVCSQQYQQPSTTHAPVYANGTSPMPSQQEPIKIRCPTCDSVLQLPTYSPQARCPNCQTIMTVPAPEHSTSTQPAYQQPVYQQQYLQPTYQQPYYQQQYYQRQPQYYQRSNGGMNTGLAVGAGLLGGLLLGEALF
jgi:LSD1 subclass zinc finger protein